jgi:hypothetical protein
MVQHRGKKTQPMEKRPLFHNIALRRSFPREGQELWCHHHPCHGLLLLMYSYSPSAHVFGSMPEAAKRPRQSLILGHGQSKQGGFFFKQQSNFYY